MVYFLKSISAAAFDSDLVALSAMFGGLSPNDIWT